MLKVLGFKHKPIKFDTNLQEWCIVEILTLDYDFNGNETIALSLLKTDEFPYVALKRKVKIIYQLSVVNLSGVQNSRLGLVNIFCFW